MKPRFHRMFAADGRCLNVAVDHGLFGEPSFLAGAEDMSNAVAVLAEARPDAIQLSLGQAPLLQNRRGSDKPALVLRSDVANIYGREHPGHLFSELIEDAVGHAVRLDAACLCVNLLLIPGEPELHRQCVQNVTRLKRVADEVGMPLMVEPLAMSRVDGPYGVNGDTKTIVTLVRQAVELGADVVKADPTDELGDYLKVIEAAGDCPVLVRGGGRATDEEVLSRAVVVINLGARGLVYGRNVIQHRRPEAMTRALLEIVHHGLGLDEALKILRA